MPRGIPATTHAIPPATAADMLQHLLETTGRTTGQVARSTGLEVTMLGAVLAGIHRLRREEIGLPARDFPVSRSGFTFGE